MRVRLKNLEWAVSPQKPRGPKETRYECFLGAALGTFYIVEEKADIDDWLAGDDERVYRLWHNNENLAVEPTPMAAARYADEYLKEVLLELVLEEE